MPPADNNTPAPAPTPTPTPEQPKQGFFAKLFGLGKKSKDETPVIPPHESHTPPPQLDDPSSGDGSAPAEPAAVDSASSSVDAAPDVPSDPDKPVTSFTVDPDAEPPTLAVPDSLKAKPIEADGTEVSPTLQTQPPAAGQDPAENAPDASPTGSSPEEEKQ